MFALALGAAPVSDIRDGVEVLEACAQTSAEKDPVPVLVRVRKIAKGKTSKLAEGFASKKAADLIIAEGELILEKESQGSLQHERAVLIATSICDGYPNQFLNNVTIVGRMIKEAKTTETGVSASRTVVVNRYVKKSDQEKPEEVPDWFKVRGFGFTKQRLIDTPKGALVEVNGMLMPQTSRKDEQYVEIKSRKIKVHSKSKAGGNNDPASGTSAAGYDHESFTGDSEMPDNWN